MKRSLITAALTLLTLPALTPSRLWAAAPTTQDFISQAVTGDMFEILSSQLAGERTDGATKAFAAQMIADHGKTSDELQKMLASNAVAGVVPSGMNGAQQAMLDKLKTLNGAEFAKQYRADQVKAHEEAIAAFTAFANTGDHAGMREWAIKTLPTLEHHLEAAQGLGS